MRRFAGGSVVVPDGNPKQVAIEIARLVAAPRPTHVNEEFADTFNRRRIAAQVARVFDEVSGRAEL